MALRRYNPKEWMAEARFQEEYPIRYYYYRIKDKLEYWPKEQYKALVCLFDSSQEVSFKKRLLSYYYSETTTYEVWISVRRFLRNIRKVIKWMPIIWNVQSWDFAFIFDLIEHQIESMAQSIGEGHSADRGVHRAELEYVLVLLEKMQNFDGEHCPYYIDDSAIPVSTRMRVAQDAYEKDMKKMFDYMVKHYNRWWD